MFEGKFTESVAQPSDCVGTRKAIPTSVAIWLLKRPEGGAPGGVQIIEKIVR